MGHQKFTRHVEEISPAIGSKFSVIKPDNAIGNFTKVVHSVLLFKLRLIQIKKI
ncbi:hypothetical protein HMPREF0023_0822 [Acinetobacter sp. ATCC 27244]|jgi:multidrug resistance efflux pump|nr:hypothetical protein HMPREF0023_0822 [Acinetobacter sp. ATCC 27244]